MTDDTLLYDYLDELLDPEEAKAAEAAIARDPARFAEIARRRAILYRPYALPAQRARRPRAASVVRYAAIFLLGVLTPFLIPLPRNPLTPNPSRRPPSWS